MKKTAVLILFLCTSILLQASKTDTTLVHSASMNKSIKTVVVTPDGYERSGSPYPVLYLLHGYSDNYSCWVRDFPMVEQFADLYGMIIVSADGNFSSWYIDSPVDPSVRYETYIAKELVSFIDNNYNTVKNREGRAITGLSMGGYGSLYLALRHQDVFGAAGSMSGGVDFRPFPSNWDLSKRLGDMAVYPENWDNNIIVNQLYLTKNDQLAIIIDCGVNDFFIEVNRELHQKMLYLNIKHDYIERPGGHTLNYWRNALEYQVVYFNNFFRRINS